MRIKGAKFTESEIEYIKNNFKILPISKIAKDLNSSDVSIRQVLSRNNLFKCSIGQENKKLRPQGKKRCNKCKEIKNFNETDFRIHNGNKGVSHLCRKCEYIIFKERRIKKSSTLEGIIKIKINDTHNRKKNSTLTKQELIEIYYQQEGKCFYTKTPLFLGMKNPEMLSIDRKDSNLPYTKENVVLCCWIVNQMKSDKSIDEFIKWCKLVAFANN